MRNYTYTAYHGSPVAKKIKQEGFKNVSRRRKTGKKTLIPTMGTHLVKDKTHAKYYGEPIKVKVTGKFMPDSEYKKLYQKLLDEGYPQPGYRNGILYGRSFISEIKKRVKAKGYDGVNGTEMVVFNPKDIKIIK